MVNFINYYHYYYYVYIFIFWYKCVRVYICVYIYINSYCELPKYVCMSLYVCTSMYVRSCHWIATRLVACCYPQQENPENRWLDACNLLPSPLRCRPLQLRSLRLTKVRAAETTPVGEACHHASNDLALARHTARPSER